MKKRTRNKLLAFIAVMLIAVLVVMPVSAANGPYQKKNPLTETEVTFTKDFKVRNDCNVPASEFTFTVTPGDAIPFDEQTPELYPVYAGIIPGLTITPLSGTAATAAAGEDSVDAALEYAAQTKAQASHGGDDVTYSTYSGENYYKASKTVTLNFANVEFTEPGVYRYIITETGTDATISVDSTPKTLDVYVEDVSSGTANIYDITGFVMYNGDNLSAPNKDGSDVTTKSYVFTNVYPTASLTFGKEVTGNQGSMDKYFDFTLTMTGPVDAILNADLSKADGTITIPSGKTSPNAATTCINSQTDFDQPTTITLVDDGRGTGTKTVHFYLRDGQYITITGLADGMTYALSENAEEYSSTDSISAGQSGIDKDGDGNKDALTDSVSGTITKDSQGNLISIYTGFTNDKEGVIPTGVILSVAPWAIAGVVILAGVVFFAIRSRKKYEEE